MKLLRNFLLLVLAHGLILAVLLAPRARAAEVPKAVQQDSAGVTSNVTVPVGKSLTINGTLVAPGVFTYRGGARDLAFTLSAGNPLLPGGGEASTLMLDATTAVRFYRLVPANSTDASPVYRQTANNSTLTNWSSGIATSGPSGFFPYVFQVGSTYYLLLQLTQHGRGPYHIYSSTDQGLTWADANGGTAILTPGNTTSDHYYLLQNLGATVVNGTMYIAAEVAYGTGNVQTGFTFLTCPLGSYSGLQAQLVANPACIPYAGAPDVKYSARYDALIVFYSATGYGASHGTGPNDFRQQLKVVTAPRTGALNTQSTWTKASLAFPELYEPSDFDLCFTGKAACPLLLFYNYNQVTGYQAFSRQVTNADELYEAITHIDLKRHDLQAISLLVGSASALAWPETFDGLSFQFDDRVTGNFSWFSPKAINSLYFGNSRTDSARIRYTTSGDTATYGTAFSSGNATLGSARGLSVDETTGDITYFGDGQYGVELSGGVVYQRNNSTGTHVWLKTDGTTANLTLNANGNLDGTGRFTPAASTTSFASLKLPPGVAPSAPENGEVWTTASGFYARIGGVSYNLLAGGGSGVWGGITGTLTDQADLVTALGLKAPLASPTFTGTPAAPTATGGTNTTQLATTAFVQTAVGTKLTAASNLSDVANVATARASLGLGSGDTVTHTQLNLGGTSQYNLKIASGVLRLTNTATGTYSYRNAADSADIFTINANGNLDGTGVITTTSTTEATIGGAGSIVTAGGLYTAKKIISGTSIQAVGAVTGSNLSGTNTGDQNLFGSVVVSGQTTVTASANPTALTLVAGTGVTITTDNTAKSVTITAPGGGTGDVTAASSFGTDNRIIRSDGTGKGVQASAVTISDAGSISGVLDLAITGDMTIDGTFEAGTLNVTTFTIGTLTGILKGTSGAISAITPGSGIETWLATPSSANLAAALTDEVGSGSALFGDQAVSTTSKPTFANVGLTNSTLTYGSTVAVDFGGDAFKTLTLTGNWTPGASSNIAAGKSVTVRIVGDSTGRTLDFSGRSWTFVGAAAPTTIAANKTAILTLTAFSTTDASVVAAYAVQP